MGLFDDLRKAANQLINAAETAAKNTPTVKTPNSSEFKNAAEQLRNTLNNIGGNKPTSQQPKAAPQQNTVQQPKQPEQPEIYDGGTFWEYDDHIPVEKKLNDILAQKFAQYQVKNNVSPTEIGGTGKFMDYSYGIYLNGTPKLFIMLIGKTTKNHRLYRWSNEQAQKAGIPMINIVRHFPNRPEYLEQKLAQYL